MNLGLLETFKKNYEGALSFFSKIFSTYKELDAYVKQVSIDNVYNILVTLNRADEADRIKSQIKNKPEDQARNILFVLDCSGSMQGKFISQCKTSIKDIINTYLTPHDGISLLTFNNVTRTVFENKNKGQNLDHIMSSIDTIDATGGTAFYDALKLAIEKNTIGDKKWIVSLTDGDDNKSRSDHNTIVKLIEKNPVNLIIITVGSLQNKDIIQKICDTANKKGLGKLLEVSHSSIEIEMVFKRVIQLIIGQLHVESL
jgi:Mg-chelatase subunit ChlD